MLFEFEDKALAPLEEKVRAQERLSFEDGVLLWNSFDLLGVGYLANIVRERLHGDKTYFIHNRHINPTNICVNSCRLAPPDNAARNAKNASTRCRRKRAEMPRKCRHTVTY